MEPIIKVEHVDFWYDKGKPLEFHALNDVSFEINKGEYVACFGSSGSGKSTLLYLIAGIEQVQSGKIIINGRDISSLSRQELAIYRQIGVGMIFQQFNLIPSLTVAQNVMFPMLFLGANPERAKKKVAELLTRVQLDTLADRFPSELSGGQQQRVSIVRALANNPPIIIADEPLGNLDSVNATTVLDFLRELNEKDGRTVIMVTHEAWSLRDVKKIFYIKDGVIETGASPAPEGSVQKTLSEHLYEKLSPELSGHKLAAHVLSELLLRGFPDEERTRLESLLDQWLENKLTTESFDAFLSQSWQEGGLGLLKARSSRIMASINDLATEKRTVQDIYKELEANPESSLYDDIEKLKQWLLKDYKGQLTEGQEAQFSEIIADRVRGIISAESFVKVLNLPRSESGLGFAIRTAHRIADKFELILSEKEPLLSSA